MLCEEINAVVGGSTVNQDLQTLMDPHTVTKYTYVCMYRHYYLNYRDPLIFHHNDAALHTHTTMMGYTHSTTMMGYTHSTTMMGYTHSTTMMGYAHSTTMMGYAHIHTYINGCFLLKLQVYQVRLYTI